jgi:hypothetical protein
VARKPISAETREKNKERARRARAERGGLSRAEYEAKRKPSAEEKAEKRREYSRRYRSKLDPAVRAARSREWVIKNPDKRLAITIRPYGLTVEQFGHMLASQRGMCSICEGPPKRPRLSVDHCHKTGRVRGLLCERCNNRIAAIEDDAWVAKARAYLERE